MPVVVGTNRDGSQHCSKASEIGAGIDLIDWDQQHYRWVAAGTPGTDNTSTGHQGNTSQVS